VTPKRADTTAHVAERRQLRPQFLLVGVLLGSGVLAVFNLVWGLTASYHHPEIVVMTLLWTLVDAGMLLLGVRAVLRRRHARQSYRFPVQLAAELVDPSAMARASQLLERRQSRARSCCI
jgi:hypothetical protein